MNKLTHLFLISAIASLFAMAGCRTQHLGEAHGQRYRAAFQGQANGHPKENLAEMSDDDAKIVLEKHREEKDGRPMQGGLSSPGRL